MNSVMAKLIIALDVPTAPQARAVVAQLRGCAAMFKIGSQLFTAAGPSLVREMVQMGERVFLDSPTLTPLLKRLEAAGFVTRNRSGADERQVIVSLTAAGKRLRERAVAIPGCVAAAMECAPGEIDTLRSRLTDMRSKLYKNAG